MSTAILKEPITRKVGRPTKYSKEILAKSLDYLDNYADHKHAIPSIVGLAKVLHISSKVLHEWMKDDRKKEFRYIIDTLRDNQHEVLVSNGLNGGFNSAITKLVLSKHGYSDTQGNQGVSVNISIDRSCGVKVSQGKDSVTIEHED